MMLYYTKRFSQTYSHIYSFSYSFPIWVITEWSPPCYCQRVLFSQFVIQIFLEGLLQVAGLIDRLIDSCSTFLLHKWNHVCLHLTILRDTHMEMSKEVSQKYRTQVNRKDRKKSQIKDSAYLQGAEKGQKRLHLCWSHFIKLNGRQIDIFCVILLFYFWLFFTLFDMKTMIIK